MADKNPIINQLQRLFDLINIEFTMKQIIIQHPGDTCTHPGTYFCVQDPAQTIVMRSEEIFPQTDIIPPERTENVLDITNYRTGHWRLSYHDSPYKRPKDYIRPLITTIILIFLTFLIIAAIVAPFRIF